MADCAKMGETKPKFPQWRAAVLPLLPAPLFLSPKSTVGFSNILYYLVRPLLAPCLQSGGGPEGESTHISAAASLPLLPLLP